MLDLSPEPIGGDPATAIRHADPVAGEVSVSTQRVPGYNGAIGTEVADPISGTVPLRSYLCEVRRADAAAAAAR